MLLKSAIESWSGIVRKKCDPREAANKIKMLRTDHPFLKSLSQNDIIQESLYQSISLDLEQDKPIQYITGLTYFYDRFLRVDSSTLIPRSETEELVHRIVKDNAHKKDLKILDIGTGTGCIPIILADQLNGKVDALDVSSQALDIARINAEECGVDVAFRVMDFLDDSAWDVLQLYDIIVSNPPYIDIAEKNKMGSDVISHEPHLALFTEDGDPLQFYRAIKLFAERHLTEEGIIYLEINEFRVEETKEIFSSDYSIQVIQDLQGKSRMLKCSKLSS